MRGSGRMVSRQWCSTRIWHAVCVQRASCLEQSGVLLMSNMGVRWRFWKSNEIDDQSASNDTLCIFMYLCHLCRMMERALMISHRFGQGHPALALAASLYISHCVFVCAHALTLHLWPDFGFSCPNRQTGFFLRKLAKCA